MMLAFMMSLSFMMKTHMIAVCQEDELVSGPVVVQIKLLEVFGSISSAGEHLALVVAIPYLCLVIDRLLVVLNIRDVFTTIFLYLVFVYHRSIKVRLRLKISPIFDRSQ